MAGINSLGIGSGVLTADVIDQLREADNSVILKPLESKLELSTQKEDAYKLLDGYMDALKSSSSSLGGENLYLGRQTSGSDDFVTVTARSGADLQSFNITEVVKAEKDVWNTSTVLASTTTSIPSIGSGTLNINVGGEDLEIEYNSATTLDDIRLAINESKTFGATATNLKIGEDQYTFSLTADNFNEAITFTDSQNAKRKEETVISGDSTAGDTFTWDDGNGNSLLINLVDGETAEQTGSRIADAINADGTLGGIYTAVATQTGFTIEAQEDAYQFSGSNVFAGASPQTAVRSTTSEGYTKQLNTVTLAGNAVAGDTFKWSDGTNEITVNLVDTETEGESGTRIADAINTDPTLSALYTATATADGFTIEAKNHETTFSGTSTSTGSQSSAEIVTNTQQKPSLLEQLDLSNIQTAREASFKFNGIEITRSDNTIDDLINGVSINLNKNHSAGDSSSISVTQNDTTIKTEMELFVTNYNTLTANLKDLTIYDQETGVAGIFNSETFIKSISGELKRIISASDSNGNSLYNYGMSFDQDGVMSFDSSAFSTKLAEDSSTLEELFRGASATTTLYKQQNTVTLTGNAVAGDTFTWDDGTNGVTVNLIDGETPEETGARIAAAINADSILKNLYTAVETSTGFTITSKLSGTEFSGNSVSTGSQTSREVTTTQASTTANDEKIGIFQQLDIKMLSYTNSSGLLSNFNDKLSNEKSSTISQYDKQKEALDARYDTMTKRFAAYDAVINKLNNQFASLKSMIDAEYDNDN